MQPGETTYLSVRQEGGVTVAKVTCPRVSDFEAAALKTDLKQYVEKLPAKLVIDLTDVLLVTSTGLGMLVQVRGTANTTGGKVVLAGLSNELVDLFRLTNLHRLFTITPDAKSGVEKCA
ncbi:MAG: STAS domain-containing protein [Phycisphaerales bacterium]|jgi:anti-sigma B factor antagonist